MMIADSNVAEFVEIPDEIGECRALVALDISTNIVPG